MLRLTHLIHNRRLLGIGTIVALPVVAPAFFALAVQSVSIAPVVVQSGAQATGTVRLDLSFHSGASVLLSSSNTALATVPSRIKVLPTFRSSTFQVTTLAGAGGCTTISAQLAGSTQIRSALIHARPTITPSAVNVTLQTDTVVGGTPLTGSVTVPMSAGIGAVVQLASSNPTVIVPASVSASVQNEGVLLATFNVTTSLVPGPGTCSIITATRGTAQSRVLLRVMPLVQG